VITPEDVVDVDDGQLVDRVVVHVSKAVRRESAGFTDRTRGEPGS
jgi:hypothetical protein